MTADVKIYTTPTCPYCVRAKQLLQSKGVIYTEVNLALEPTSTRQALTERTGSHTVPQIFINDQFVGGCDDLYALERASKLDALLV